MPKELTAARRGLEGLLGQGRTQVGTKKGEEEKLHWGLGVAKCRLGGSCRWRSACTVLISPATPAAASRWPILDLTEPMAQVCKVEAWEPKTRERAAISQGSPKGVPVPWASM